MTQGINECCQLSFLCSFVLSWHLQYSRCQDGWQAFKAVESVFRAKDFCLGTGSVHFLGAAVNESLNWRRIAPGQLVAEATWGWSAV